MLHGKYLFVGRQEDSSEGTSTQDCAFLVLLHTDSRSRTSSLLRPLLRLFMDHLRAFIWTPNLGCIVGHMAAEVEPADQTQRAPQSYSTCCTGCSILDYHSTWLGILAPANEVW
jgi:hypothetical protein